MTNRLRIGGLIVQFLAFLDDGESLTTVEIQPVRCSLDDLTGSPLHDRIVADVAAYRVGPAEGDTRRGDAGTVESP